MAGKQCKGRFQLKGHCMISRFARLAQIVLICSVMVVGKLPGLDSSKLWSNADDDMHGERLQASL